MAIFQSPNYPSYAHTPLLVKQHQDRKLSKQNHATAINNENALNNVLYCLTLLGMNISNNARKQGLAYVLQEAITHWRQGILFPSHEIIVT